MQLSGNIFKFLKLLQKNNNREWFGEHKSLYEESKLEFEAFVKSLIDELSHFDNSIAYVDPRKAIFRIYRDVRFSKDKSPYKVNFGAHINATDKSSGFEKAGYYVHLQPSASFIGGGAYMPPSTWLKAFRQQIDHRGDELLDIIKDKEFKKYFKDISGEKLSLMPKGYAKDHPYIDLLKYKSITAIQNMDDEFVQSKGFLKHCGNAFKALKPFNDFLNEANSNMEE